MRSSALSVAAATIAALAGSASGATFATSDFPPAGGAFFVPTISFLGGAATIDNLLLNNFSASFALNDDGFSHDYAFTAIAHANGLDFPANMTFSISNTSIIGTVRQYDIELTQLDIDASPFFGGPLLVRESPTEDSQGTLTISELPGGMFQISSFFDVFVELSIDGSNWIPADGAGQAALTVVPLPLAATSAMAVLGLVALRRRRPIG
jgi:hypothetical protein